MATKQGVDTTAAKDPADWVTGDEPMTGPQQSYLYTLGREAGAFLADLHRRLGPLTVVWDRNNIHSRSKVVKAWLAKHPGVVAEDFPGYVPDLNPDEGVWGWTKYGRLANLAADDKDGLWGRVVDELVTLKFRHDLLRGFQRQTALP
ncbi:MAG TPA: DUF3072 domain-containing protein, partial [Gemmataceae bacterium]|nr:DUF3072 domain-containing protein [Gemmataceae bacterium]